MNATTNSTIGEERPASVEGRGGKLSASGMMEAMMGSGGMQTLPPLEVTLGQSGLSKEMQGLMMYLFQEASNNQVQQQMIMMMMANMAKKNTEETCTCKCPEVLCPGCEKQETLVVYGDGKFKGQILGEYVYDKVFKCFRQRSSKFVSAELNTARFLYRVAGSWYIGPLPGEARGWMINTKNSSSVPLFGWKVWETLDGEGYNWMCAPSIRVAVGRTHNWCDRCVS